MPQSIRRVDPNTQIPIENRRMSLLLQQVQWPADDSDKQALNNQKVRKSHVVGFQDPNLNSKKKKEQFMLVKSISQEVEQKSFIT